MAIRSKQEPGVWDQDRAEEIEADLEKLADMVDEVDLIRREFPIQAWVPHERFMKLQLSIIDRRLSHLLLMQGIAPEKGSLANLSPKELKKKIAGYQEELCEMMKKAGIV